MEDQVIAKKDGVSMMADEMEVNPTLEGTLAQDEQSEWNEQVNDILAPKDPEPLRD